MVCCHSFSGRLFSLKRSGVHKQTLIKASVIFTSFKSVPHNVDVLLSRAHLILSLGFGRLVFKKLVKATTFSEHEQELELLDSESELELESESESESELDNCKSDSSGS